MSYEDAFAVFLVDEKDTVEINYIAGQVPFLRKLQQDVCHLVQYFHQN